MQGRTEQNRSDDLTSKTYPSFISGPDGCRFINYLPPREEENQLLCVLNFRTECKLEKINNKNKNGWSSLWNIRQTGEHICISVADPDLFGSVSFWSAGSASMKRICKKMENSSS